MTAWTKFWLRFINPLHPIKEDRPYKDPIAVYLWHYVTADGLEAMETKTTMAPLVYNRMCKPGNWNTEDTQPPYRNLPVKSRRYALLSVTPPKMEDAGSYLRIVRHCYLYEEVGL